MGTLLQASAGGCRGGGGRHKYWAGWLLLGFQAPVSKIRRSFTTFSSLSFPIYQAGAPPGRKRSLQGSSCGLRPHLRQEHKRTQGWWDSHLAHTSHIYLGLLFVRDYWGCHHQRARSANSHTKYKDAGQGGYESLCPGPSVTQGRVCVTAAYGRNRSLLIHASPPGTCTGRAQKALVGGWLFG